MSNLTPKELEVVVACVEYLSEGTGSSILNDLIGETEEEQLTYLRNLLRKLKGIK